MRREDIVEAVYDGARCTVDFRKRTVKLNGKLVELDLIDSNVDYIEVIYTLYELYKCSRPSERSESRGRNYFKAKSYDELTDTEFITGLPREVARTNLELYVLQTILSGCWNAFEWGKKWFVKREDMIILKEWIV